MEQLRGRKRKRKGTGTGAGGTRERGSEPRSPCLVRLAACRTMDDLFSVGVISLSGGWLFLAICSWTNILSPRPLSRLLFWLQRIDLRERERSRLTDWQTVASTHPFNHLILHHAIPRYLSDFYSLALTSSLLVWIPRLSFASPFHTHIMSEVRTPSS